MKQINFILIVLFLTIAITNYSIGETGKNNAQGSYRAEQVMETLSMARDLRDKGELEDSLKAYITFYHESYNTLGLSGVRLSNALPEIRQLGDLYPPAIKELKTLRGSIEQTILSGDYNTKDCSELSSFDKVLDQKEKTIALYDKIVTKFGRNSLQSKNFTKAIWDELYKLKRYDEMEGIIGILARREVSLISEYMVELDFPSKRFKNDPKYREWMELKIINEGERIFKILKSIGRDEEFFIIKKWLLNLSTDARIDESIRNTMHNLK
jgi:hypothetical protein